MKVLPLYTAKKEARVKSTTEYQQNKIIVLLEANGGQGVEVEKEM